MNARARMRAEARERFTNRAVVTPAPAKADTEATTSDPSTWEVIKAFMLIASVVGLTIWFLVH